MWVQSGICDAAAFDPYAATETWPFGLRCFAPAGGFNSLFFDFTLTDGANYTENRSTTWGSIGLEFKVPSTTITITQDVPDGFGEPVMYCFMSGTSQIGGTTPSTGNSATLTIAPGQVVSCQFWNVPIVPQSGSITVNAWQCPQGTAQGLSLSDYLDLCETEHDGIEFTLVATFMVDSRVTDDGLAQWDSVQLGKRRLHVDDIAGFGDLAVFCGFTESPGGGIQHPAPPVFVDLGEDETNFLLYFEIPESEIACHWFSRPE